MINESFRYNIASPVVMVVRRRLAAARVARPVLSLVMAVCVMAGMVVMVKFSHGLFSGKAQAAINPAVLTMSPEEKQTYARDLRGLLIEDPDRFADLISQEILLVLNTPLFQRRDGDFRMWQYDNGDCVLDIYMKASAKDGFARIIHYEIRERGVASLYSHIHRDGGTVEDSNASRCIAELTAKAQSERGIDVAGIMQ